MYWGLYNTSYFDRMFQINSSSLDLEWICYEHDHTQVQQVNRNLHILELSVD